MRKLNMREDILKSTSWNMHKWRQTNTTNQLLLILLIMWNLICYFWQKFVWLESFLVRLVHRTNKIYIYTVFAFNNKRLIFCCCQYYHQSKNMCYCKKKSCLHVDGLNDCENFLTGGKYTELMVVDVIPRIFIVRPQVLVVKRWYQLLRSISRR